MINPSKSALCTLRSCFLKPFRLRLVRKCAGLRYPNIQRNWLDIAAATPPVRCLASTLASSGSLRKFFMKQLLSSLLVLLVPTLITPRVSVHAEQGQVAHRVVNPLALGSVCPAGPDQDPPATEPVPTEVPVEPTSTAPATLAPIATSEPTEQAAQNTPPVPPNPVQNPTPTLAPPVATAPPPSTVPAQASATSVPVQVDKGISNEERPIIVVEAFDTGGFTPAAGQSFHLQIRIRNRGEHLAENIRLSLASATFLPISSGSALILNKLDEGDEHTFVLDMQVVKSTSSGIHPLPISLRWDDSEGGSYSDEASIGIQVGAGSIARPILVVTSSKLPARCAPGEPFDLVLSLRNTGGLTAHNVVVRPVAGGGLALVGGSAGPTDIAAQTEIEMRMRVIVAESSSGSGSVTQQLEINYSDPDGERLSDMHSVGLIVTGQAAGQPMPMVSAYRVYREGESNSALEPGGRFQLEIDLINLGQSDAQNLSVLIGGGAGGSLDRLAPSGTSNRRFVGLLPAGATRTVTQTMIVDAGAAPGALRLELGLTYADENGEALNSSEFVGLQIGRPIRLEVRPVNVMTTTLAGWPVEFVFELVNAGTHTLNLMNARIVGEGSVKAMTGAADEFIGALESGGFYTLQAEVNPFKPGEGEILVEIEYLDDLDREQTLTQRFPLEVKPADAMEDIGPDGQPIMGRPGFPGQGPDEEAMGLQFKEESVAVRFLRGLFGFGASPRLDFASMPSPSDPGRMMPPGAEFERMDG